MPSIGHLARVVRHKILEPRLWEIFCFTSFSPTAICREEAGSPVLSQFFRENPLENLVRRLPLSLDNNTSEWQQTILQELSAEEIHRQAQNARSHRFTLLGDAEIEHGAKIDWHKDYKSGRIWEKNASWAIDFMTSIGGSDVKYPWEISRFQWLAWLGLGYWFEKNEAYAEQFRRDVEDWMQENPVGIGINWAMPMEVALRAVNWIFSAGFFYGSPNIPPEFWEKFFVLLAGHGHFLEWNLEYTRHPGNHFASNILGLVALGSIFCDSSAGKRWLKKGRTHCEREILRQNYDDGVNYEKSASYHRLVTEIFTVSALFAGKSHAFSTEFYARLEKMWDFLRAISRSDGSAPNFGDGDNGRVFRLRADENFNRLLPTMDFDLSLFGRKLIPDSPAELRAIFSRNKEIFPQLLHFNRGGYVVFGAENFHWIMDVGDYGMDGWGGHGHNDCLAMELWADGVHILADSGTGVYTANVALRNRLRSTRAHSTVEIGAAEQVEYAGLWRVKNDQTRPTLLSAANTANGFRVSAEHCGYSERFLATHRRNVALENGEFAWTLRIHDEITCPQAIPILSSLHFAPDVEVIQDSLFRLRLEATGKEFLVESSREITLYREPISLSYGQISDHTVARMESSEGNCAFMVEISGNRQKNTPPLGH